MHLEYQITFKDDLDCNEVNTEYQFKKTWLKYFYHPIPWLSLSFLCLVWGMMETAEEDKYALYVASFLSLFCLILWRFLINPKNAQSYLARRTMQNKWKQKLSQKENRIITITDEEFIFKTDNSELAWKWRLFQDFFEAAILIENTFSCSG